MTHTRTLLRLATALSGDPYLAEDLVQDVLLKTHCQWPRVAAARDPLAHARRMLVDELLSWRRSP